jgi:Tol biopolymer transport system component
MKSSHGTGAEERLVDSKEDVLMPRDWSPDGKYLLFYRASVKGNSIDYMAMDGSHSIKQFISESYTVDYPIFSPDGRWVAYESGETGERSEIFVRSFPSANGKWQISTTGGRFPKWRRDGKEFYYMAFDGTVMAVEVDGASQTFSIGKSDPLFNIPRSSDPLLYDVTPDGQRFLMGVLPGGGNPQILKLVTNWEEGIKER